MEEISKVYNMVIFTASDQIYADSVLAYIDPNKAYFKHRFYRTSCLKVQSESKTILVKDLRIFKNMKASNMVIIDNSILAFAFHLENVIPILPFYSNKDDTEFIFLKNYLLKLSKYENIMTQNSLNFNLPYFLEEAIIETKIEVKDKEEDNIISKKEEKEEKEEKEDKEEDYFISSQNKKEDSTANNNQPTKKPKEQKQINKVVNQPLKKRKSRIQVLLREALEKVKKLK